MTMGVWALILCSIMIKVPMERPARGGLDGGVGYAPESHSNGGRVTANVHNAAVSVFVVAILRAVALILKPYARPPVRRVTAKLVVSVAVAVLLARTLLQSGARALAKHASDELYQLTVIAFCLVGAWISGYMVRDEPGGEGVGNLWGIGIPYTLYPTDPLYLYKLPNRNTWV